MGLGVKRKFNEWNLSIRNFRKWFIPVLKTKLYGRELTDFKEVPIVINNFNRLSMLQKLISGLETRGYTNIFIIDNNSTYAPLLKWYEQCKYPVYMLNRNVGYLSIWETGIYKQFTDSYFAYTDSDIEICPECPENFMQYFIELLKKHPKALKVGFSLKIDDIPEHYENKDEVIKWEKQFWENKIKGENAFFAPIDTTFAVYRPFFKGGVIDFDLKYIRTDHPYSARHLPWYQDSENLSDEDIFYKNNIKTLTHWSEKQG